MSKRYGKIKTKIIGGLFIVLAGWARADVFNVNTVQAFQSALTQAAANGVSDTIQLAAGYYIGNFTFNSTEGFDLTVQAANGVSRENITLSGNGAGRALSISSTGAANITVTGVTFVRNCGNNTLGALRIATAVTKDVLVENCRFLAENNAQGIGLEITACRDAKVRNCYVMRDGTSEGDGIAISGASRTNLVEQNTLIASTFTAGGGVTVNAAQGTSVRIEGNVISGHASAYGSGVYVLGGSAAITFSGNTISGNSTYYEGGGVYLSGDGNTVTINTNRISANSAGSGGGICLSGASNTVTFSRNTISTNSSSSSSYNHPSSGGGGVCVSGANNMVMLNDNTISENSSSSSYPSASPSYGGGVGVSGASNTVTFNGNTIKGNSSSCFYMGRSIGGGVGVSGAHTVTLTGNTISGNSSSSGDGGVGVSDANTVTLSKNQINGNAGQGAYITQGAGSSMWLEGNRLTGNGHGFYLDGYTITALNNEVVKNSGGDGAGIWVKPHTQLDLVNNTITENSATGKGGGLRVVLDGVTEIVNAYNNIIFGNTASVEGDDVSIFGTGSQKKFVNNNADGMSGVWTLFTGNLNVSPAFADPVNGDYHLTTGSPCIDSGNNAAPQLPATDLDGDPRSAGVRADMGAYEFFTTDFHPADVNMNWALTATEFTNYSTAWRGGQTWGAGSNSISSDYVTRAGYLKENGGSYHNDGSARPLRWKPGL